MSADALSVSSRGFYERAKAKVGLSLVVAASSLMLLGFCSIAAGQAQANNELYKLYQSSGSSQLQKSYQALAAGYGFGAFVYIIAFIILLAASLYLSPFIAGTPNETRTIRNPTEVEGGAYSSEAPKPTPMSQTY